MTPQVKIGVLGGTGLYDMEGLTNVREVSLTTPYGNPSDTITIGELEGVEVAFLPRHGAAIASSPRRYLRERTSMR